MNDDTWNEINKHLRACMDHLGYETNTESMLSMVILVREAMTCERMDEALSKTGLEHWKEGEFGIEKEDR